MWLKTLYRHIDLHHLAGKTLTSPFLYLWHFDLLLHRFLVGHQYDFHCKGFILFIILCHFQSFSNTKLGTNFIFIWSYWNDGGRVCPTPDSLSRPIGGAVVELSASSLKIRSAWSPSTEEVDCSSKFMPDWVTRLPLKCLLPCVPPLKIRKKMTIGTFHKNSKYQQI